jgi:hypothetical protein
MATSGFLVKIEHWPPLRPCSKVHRYEPQVVVQDDMFVVRKLGGPMQ